MGYFVDYEEDWQYIDELEGFEWLQEIEKIKLQCFGLVYFVCKDWCFDCELNCYLENVEVGEVDYFLV